MKVYSQIAIGTVPKSPSKVREMKKTIAKILTIKNEKASKLDLKQKKEETKRNE